MKATAVARVRSSPGNHNAENLVGEPWVKGAAKRQKPPERSSKKDQIPDRVKLSLPNTQGILEAVQRTEKE